MIGQSMVIRRAPATMHQPEDNRTWLLQIVQARAAGQTCLPARLGLDEQTYQALSRQYAFEANSWSSNQNAQAEQEDLRQELLDLRQDEWDEIRTLLLSGRHGLDPAEEVMAAIVAAACLGGGHLWQDLGMTSRLQLHELLSYNFPDITARNTQNMRWKKFFYKQLCEQEGGYVCRSPTCEQCPTYNDCFGDET